MSTPAASAPWSASMTPVAPPTAANPTVRQLVYAGVVTGAWSGVICLILFGIGGLAGVSFGVVAWPQYGLLRVPWIAVLLAPLAAGVLGALLASLVRGRRHAGRIVYWAGSLIAIVATIAMLTQPTDADWPTRILLAVMHVVTWFLVVPQIARIVMDSEPGRSVDRGE